MKRLALLLTLLMCGSAWADDASDLIKQLDGENFLEREKAAEKLKALGKEAIPSLVKAANEGSLETAVRSIEVLKKLMEADDKPTADEAKSALEELAKSENTGTARRAKNALEPPKPEPMPAAIPNRIALGRVLPARIAQGNFARRVQTRTVNGVKTIEAEEGDRKVKIEDDPNKGIRVEITEKKNGKDVTEKFEAKNEEDLKKNHPRAHAEYEKYAKGNGVQVQFQFGAAALPGGAVPFNQRIGDMRLESAGRLLQTLGRHFGSRISEDSIKDASNESRETLKKEVTEMKNRLAELEKKLQSAIDEENKQKAAAEKPGEAQKPANAQPE